MKRLLLLLLSASCLFANASEKILFVGNSYLYYNNSVHKHFENILREYYENESIDTKLTAIGGSKLQHHSIDQILNYKIFNLDNEISSICGPQLVCPVSNARFLLNAANARWVSLYDSLYGADIIPETRGALKGNTYNPIRGKEVILYSRNLLDKIIPLKNKRWVDLNEIPKIFNNKLKLDLLNQNLLEGHLLE